jgi:hypothetical protein
MPTLKPHLTYANVVSTLCLFIVLGGSSYAAVALTKNSVRSAHIKNGQVKNADLAGGAVNSAKVGDGSLRAQDFAPGELPPGSAGPEGKQGPEGQQGAPGRDGSNATLGPTEAWREIQPHLTDANSHEDHFRCSGYTNFCFRGFGNYASGYNTVAYFKDHSGVVHVKGLVAAAGGTSQSGDEIFRLPAGYRPAQRGVHAVLMGAGSGVVTARVDVHPTGEVTLVAPRFRPPSTSRSRASPSGQRTDRPTSARRRLWGTLPSG